MEILGSALILLGAAIVIFTALCTERLTNNQFRFFCLVSGGLVLAGMYVYNVGVGIIQ